MNERILEIAKQARLKFPSEDALSPVEQKFVELIIKSCAMVGDFAHNGGVLLPSVMIKEHFGLQ